MNPLYVDIGFAVLTVILAFQGWRVGFVRTIGSLIGLVLAVTLATWGITWLEGVTGWRITANPITFIIVFLLITLILTKIIGLFIGILDLARKVFQIIPGVGMLNSILGFFLGIVQSGMIIAATAYATVNFFPEGPVRSMLITSRSISTAIEYLIQFNVL